MSPQIGRRSCSLVELLVEVMLSSRLLLCMSLSFGDRLDEGKPMRMKLLTFSTLKGCGKV